MTTRSVHFSLRTQQFAVWCSLFFLYSFIHDVGHAMAQSVIIPAEFADQEGSQVLGHTNPGRFRFHLLYLGSEFPQEPLDIIGMRIRPKSDAGTMMPVYRNLELSLTTTKEVVLDTDFAENYELALQQPTPLLSGTVETSTMRATPNKTPRDFDYLFSWEATPFRFDPADETNLLVDFVAPSGFSVPPRWDAINVGTERREMFGRVILEVSGTARKEGRFPVTEFLYRSTETEIHSLQAGDADQDLNFDQRDLVRVQIAGKYLTGQPATWGEGDWNGAPGGSVGSPPDGDAVFNQLDIVAAQQAAAYLTGPYAAIVPGGQRGDGQTSVVYDPSTGEVAVDAPSGTELTSVNIDSASGIFTGESAQNLGGSFDNDADDNIFKATFGSSFGSLSLGKVAQAGLSEQFVLSDLTVIGSLAGGGDLGDVDLVYVPEPSSALLLALGLVTGVCFGRKSQ